MTRFTLTIASTLLFAAAAAAQNCSDNTFRLTLVDGSGTALPTTGSGSSRVWQGTNEQIYLALDPALPSGVYYVHVTDPIGGHDEVLSLNEPTDRFVEVTNNAGVITLALPFSVNPNAPAFGVGLGGVGQSVPLFPYLSASWDPCHFKAWLGDSVVPGSTYDPANPYLLRGGFDSARGQCFVRSYETFTVGDGTGSDVLGFLFDDVDGNGVQDSGEPGIGGSEIRLTTPTTSVTVLTQPDGTFVFENVAIGTYTVEMTVPSGATATTPTSYTIEVCGCSDVEVADFGHHTEPVCLPCDGHTIGYWRNRHGLCLIQQHGLLAQLNTLCLANACGRYVRFANLCEYATWLGDADARNMAYMLSAQFVAMWNNVAVGFVSPDCEIVDPCLGRITIRELLRQAQASLCTNPWTPVGHPARALQTKLKNALDDANNNRNWANPCGCTGGSTGGCTGGSTGGYTGGCSTGGQTGGSCTPPSNGCYRRTHRSRCR